MTAGLFASAAGIRVHQTRLNVISNNIANVNTTGFKSNGVNFANVFAKTISGGSTPNQSLGGTNPKQIGNGVSVQEIYSDFSQGGTQFTGRSTDMLINGNGFFTVERVDQSVATSSSSFFLTRAGNFSLDSEGSLVTAAGNRVKGTSQLSGTSPATQSNVFVPQTLTIVKDLDANDQVIGVHLLTDPSVAGAGAAITAAQTAGTATQTIKLAKLTNFTVGSNGSINAIYDSGDIITVRPDQNTLDPLNPLNGRTELIIRTETGQTFGPDLSSPGGGPPDGNSSNPLDSGLLDQIGGFEIFQAPPGGTALQGMQLNLQTATVVNPNGLIYDGNNNFLPGANSGAVDFGTAGSENRGVITNGALETSNVDLTNEFTNMVVTQRGLEANSRMIRTQSEVLQTIIQSV